MEAYCMKCKEKREAKDVETVTMKNGKPAQWGGPRVRHEDVQDERSQIGAAQLKLRFFRRAFSNARLE